jgi:hypothetical protein
MSSSKKISHYAIVIGVWTSLLGVIWSPEEAHKWILTALYLHFVGRYLGLTFQNEKIIGSRLERMKFHITDFLPMGKR